MVAYKLIKLTRGVVAAVDEEDFERVNKHLWWPVETKGTTTHIQTRIKNSTILLHRFILGLQPNDGRLGDHWNGNIYDNRRYNLRVCGYPENRRNSKKRNGVSSRFKGVSKKSNNAQHFSATIHSRGRQTYLGYFSDEIEAAKAYDAAARKEFGKFACLNFPRKSELPPEPPSEVIGQKLRSTSKHVGHRDRRSEYVGVYRDKNRWKWSVRHRKNTHTKHGFCTEEEAAKARDIFIITNDLPNRRNF